jgi:hypothetical protein
VFQGIFTRQLLHCMITTLAHSCHPHRAILSALTDVPTPNRRLATHTRSDIGRKVSRNVLPYLYMFNSPPDPNATYALVSFHAHYALYMPY